VNTNEQELTTQSREIKSSSAMGKNKAICIVVIAAVLILFTWLLYQIFGGGPKLHVKAKREGNDIVFLLDYSGINRLMYFKVYRVTDREMLWDVKMGSVNTDKIIYGTIPESGCRQIFPPIGTIPLSLKNENRIIAVVTYQYDKFPTAMAGTQEFILEIED